VRKAEKRSNGGRWFLHCALSGEPAKKRHNKATKMRKLYQVGYQEAPVYLVAKKLGEMLQINIEKYFRLKS
jgi:hypothetical protein